MGAQRAALIRHRRARGHDRDRRASTAESGPRMARAQGARRRRAARGQGGAAHDPQLVTRPEHGQGTDRNQNLTSRWRTQLIPRALLGVPVALVIATATAAAYLQS